MREIIKTGVTIARAKGYSLTEYSSGDNEESYYKIITTKGHDEMDYTYLSPKKNHKLARAWFADAIKDYTKAS